MTPSHRARAAVLVALLCLVGAPARSDDDFQSDFDTVQVVSANVQGKNVYIPSTIVLTSGKSYKLSLFNTTDTPHGFSIAAIGVEEILQPGVEHVIELPKLEDGRLHEIRCQLHPAHRTGTLVVLDGD